MMTIAAGSAMLVWSAAAQDVERAKAKMEAEQAQAQLQMKVMGAVRGMTVKGAPYAADEITETNQVLADGTRIHRETKVAVARDGEGRTRRESPDNITITDPVANVTYFLNPKTMTGQKLAMSTGTFTALRTPGEGGKVTGSATSTFTMSSSGDGPVSIVLNGEKLDEKAVAEAMARAKASGQTVTYEHRTVTTDGRTGYAVAGGMVRAMPAGKRAAGDPIGTQMIEGVNASGTRHVTTIEAGAIGNDRPIAITMENWYSEDLQMDVLTKRSDPRTGEETFRMTNIRRGEPGGYLFQPPSGYQISERK
jgi:hypothetical protein